MQIIGALGDQAMPGQAFNDAFHAGVRFGGAGCIGKRFDATRVACVVSGRAVGRIRAGGELTVGIDAEVVRAWADLLDGEASANVEQRENDDEGYDDHGGMLSVHLAKSIMLS